MSEHRDFEDKDGKYYSVYIRETEEYFSGECVECGFCLKKCDKGLKITTEIVEMYDAYGIDAGKKSKVYEQALKHFRADEPFYECNSCCGDFDLNDLC